MVIYDEKNGRLYIPQNGDQVFVIDKDEVFNQGYKDGYNAGMEQAAKDCHNDVNE